MRKKILVMGIASLFLIPLFCLAQEESNSTSSLKQELKTDKQAIGENLQTIKQNAQASRQKERQLREKMHSALQSGDMKTARTLRDQLSAIRRENIQQKQADIQSLRESRKEMRQDAGRNPSGAGLASEVRQDLRQIRGDRREIRGDTRAIQGEHREIQQDKQEIQGELQEGDKEGVKQDVRELKEDQQEFKGDRKELQGDVKDLRNDHKDLRQDIRGEQSGVTPSGANPNNAQQVNKPPQVKKSAHGVLIPKGPTGKSHGRR